jgi:hypothetical protein
MNSNPYADRVHENAARQTTARKTVPQKTTTKSKAKSKASNWKTIYYPKNQKFTPIYRGATEGGPKQRNAKPGCKYLFAK